jgi:prepilin-type N-terminal cleavage/methylation domain-containing protein
MTGKRVHSRGTLRPATARGFSLIELLVAIAVFLIVSSAAFTLFNRQQVLLTQQQGLAGLNIGLRNALTQIQIDAVNAANGLVLGAYVPAWPVGATIFNQNPASACNNATTFQYSSTCFDTLNIILADPLTPTCNLAANLNTSTASTVNVVPSTGTASTYAGNFKTGDTLLVVSGNGSPFTTITLTANGTASGSNIALHFTSTSAAGINPKDSPPPPTGTGLMITTDGLASDLGVNYYQNTPTTDWVIRLAPITYYVDTTNSNDPKLMRQVYGGTADVVMDQVVGFKVGAALVNDSTDNYYYNASAANATNGGYNNQFTQIRSIRVSLMARTTPNGTSSYRNQFDGGPYQVLGGSIVVNQRNLSMNDQ